MTRCSISRLVFPLTLVALCALLIVSSALGASEPEQITPVLMSVPSPPVPFVGSDQRVHLVYELWVTNFSSGDTTIEQVEVLGDGALLHRMETAEIARRLQPAGQREPVAVLSKSMQALLFIHVTLAPGASAPHQISHRIQARVMAAPPSHQEIAEAGGTVAVNTRPVAQIGPPLAGAGFISADSCCDASRHTRASLPVNGHVFVAQRFAVDWEQIDKDNRIYSGPRERLESYTIFGKPAIAAADATVVSVTDGLPEQTPGKFPTDLSLEAADGNSVILDLGDHRYALYAHLQPGSIQVHRGEKVRRGQVLGKVGNTGNSVAPHLHFHVMDGPSPLMSSGLPYQIEGFQVTGGTAGTEAFDHAEAEGTPLAITPVSPVQQVRSGLPLDQFIVRFPEAR